MTLSGIVAVEAKVVMVRHGLNQEELARRLGRSQGWVSKRLAGKTPFRLDELRPLTDALEVDHAEFMDNVIAIYNAQRDAS